MQSYEEKTILPRHTNWNTTITDHSSTWSGRYWSIAIIALGHIILIASYLIIKDKVELNEQGEEYLLILGEINS